MDPSELLRLLRLDDIRAGPPEGPALIVSGVERASAESASLTALEVDDWGLRRGADLLAGSDRLNGLSLDALAIADCHAAAFDPEPRLVAACRDEARRQFFSALLETPEYRALHGSTRLDPLAAEIGAVHFAEELDRYRNDSESVSDATVREIAALRSAARAARSASEEVTECRDGLTAFGLGPGRPGSNDPKAVAELFRRIRNDPSLRAIAALAGRYRRLAQSKQRRKTRHGVDDVVGVELSGDLGRVLPHELAKLTEPLLEAEMLRRLVERELMCREYHACEPVAKGPIIVCVDESGSMAGEPAHTAKAIALALAWIARQQGRWCALVAYSGDSGERLLPLSPRRWDELALADWLTEFLGRGSTLDVPVRELPRMYADLKAPLGDTDVIALTDCRCSIPAGICDDFNAWKRSVRARLVTLVIGDDAGDLVQVSDEIHLVRSLAVTEEAVGHVLSI
jgi:uncharacterized protein with von Willebrand factor type A (vWA) domain